MDRILRGLLLALVVVLSLATIPIAAAAIDFAKMAAYYG